MHFSLPRVFNSTCQSVYTWGSSITGKLITIERTTFDIPSAIPRGLFARKTNFEICQSPPLELRFTTLKHIPRERTGGLKYFHPFSSTKIDVKCGDE